MFVIEEQSLADRNREVIAKTAGKVISRSSGTDIDNFIDAVRLSVPGQGKLIFALDATMSRQPTWDLACKLQSEMFSETAKLGTLDIQLVYYRGFRECRSSRWIRDSATLGAMMEGICVAGGQTQIKKILKHAKRVAKKDRASILVFVGDAMEESLDQLAHIAGQLALLNMKLLMFQEGEDAQAHSAFAELARITDGAHCVFDSNSPGELRELLHAAAIYAVGGKVALENSRSSGATKLLGYNR
ncbi:MAG: VWA domain-containing protein [Cohaesibacteraceae bacterium]|nr:VWA domain-containing protein [Cohaesibacteraceae bacterium]MBL4876601.1 VWA domain-containing protein [Cohaesibacteraceae bacterium]